MGSVHAVTGAWHDFVGVLACLDERALPPSSDGRRVVARCLEGRIMRRACPCARRRLPTACREKRGAIVWGSKGHDVACVITNMVLGAVGRGGDDESRHYPSAKRNYG